MPEVLSLGEIQRVLQSLLAEGVPIRDLGTIVEAIGDKARTTRDTGLLRSTPARRWAGRSRLPTWTSSCACKRSPSTPRSSRRSATSITQTTDGEYLAMDPPRAQAIVGALRAQVEHASARGGAAGAALLGARAPPPAPPDRPGPAALAGLLLQRDRPGHQRRDDRSHPRMSTPGGPASERWARQARRPATAGHSPAGTRASTAAARSRS